MTIFQKVETFLFLISLTEEHFNMSTLGVFNHLAPSPSFLSESPQFHLGTHLSRGDGTNESQGAEGIKLLEREYSSSVLLTPGTGLEGSL